MNPDIVWSVISGAALAAFGAAETYYWRLDHDPDHAGKPSGTLTATLRRWLGLDPVRWWRPIGAAGLVAFLGWLAGHLLLGTWNV